MRAEGLTELTADIVPTCTGGTPTPGGVQIPQTDIIVYLNTQVANRQFGTWSDAYLLLDEPGSGLPNAVATQTMCANSNGICPIAATGLGGGLSGGDYSGNAAIVPAGSGGAVSFYATNTTDLVVDINGYFAAPGTGGLNFYTVTPCRIVDTRGADGTLGGPIMGASTTRTFPLSQGPCGIPDSAAAYSLNMTVKPPGYLGFLTLWPTGDAQPVVSTLNALEGQLVANAALVQAGTGGAVNVFVTNATHVVIDTNVYFQ